MTKGNCSLPSWRPESNAYLSAAEALKKDDINPEHFGCQYTFSPPAFVAMPDPEDEAHHIGYSLNFTSEQACTFGEA
eukprot:CAMPEP_0170512344 /NCGR_PEP_ID=MMETSP0208-20121228/66796_1 /TAXON_ID=197538 /ORGANISM="Strombidium inclinatum, Strain S3" /LENGTH=76 /DNA_ID=CAMNT_0010795963 /DNA_START=226 /DNA_END=456 /DNA_ORIENTATION=+